MDPVDIPRMGKREYCHQVSKDGYVCDLYRDHISILHADKHFHHRWLDGE